MKEPEHSIDPFAKKMPCGYCFKENGWVKLPEKICCPVKCAHQFEGMCLRVEKENLNTLFTRSLSYKGNESESPKTVESAKKAEHGGNSGKKTKDQPKDTKKWELHIQF